MGEFIGFKEEKKLALKYAVKDVPVLITGESGVGKELMAKFIYANSGRNNKIYNIVNCAAFNGELITSELFGHRRGSFTGAVSDRKGRFASADGGTIFLDEIGDMPMSVQAKLLRTIEYGEIQRVGEDAQIKVDVRTICATNHNLRKCVREGKFRRDFFNRIGVFHIHIPPLRERMDEIPELIEYFFDFFTKKYQKNPGIFREEIVKSLKRQAMGYHWPGNIRQLKGEIEKFVILEEGFLSNNKKRNGTAFLSFSNLPNSYLNVGEYVVSVENETGSVFSGTLEKMENETGLHKKDRNSFLELSDSDRKIELEKVLLETQGNVTKARENLGLPKGSIGRIISRLKLREFARKLREEKKTEQK